MSCRVVVITEIIAPYRIPVFNALAQDPDIDLHVIFLSRTDPALRDWRVYTDEIRFSYEVLPSWRSRLGAHNLLLNRGLTSALVKASPDVIVCGGYNYLASWEAMSWAKQNQIRFLLWIESTQQDQRSGRTIVEFLKKKFVSGCDGFIVPGRSSREYVRSLGIPDEMISTAPNAVANSIFESRSRETMAQVALDRRRLKLPDRYLLFVGRLVPEKGIQDLLQAYDALDDSLKSELSLVIVGDGPLRHSLQLRASRLMQGSVKITGFVQRDELAAYYALAEMFVFPTYTDTWGLVVNEEMACGLPIIASSAAGCVADLVIDGWNGRVIKPGHISELTSSILHLAMDSQLRARMACRNREIISRYSPESCAEGMAMAAMNLGVLQHD